MSRKREDLVVKPGDVVVIEYTHGGHDNFTQEAFEIGSDDRHDHLRKPIPLYREQHAWSSAALGKRISDSIDVEVGQGADLYPVTAIIIAIV